ncbi:MAG: hypothetical protein KFW09_04715 [Oscillospiraceae bacterium]|nr:hypothetical protein [Oscillospiraceae bacterium]
MSIDAFDINKNRLVFADNSIDNEKNIYICNTCRLYGKEVPLLLVRSTTPHFRSYKSSNHDSRCDFQAEYNYIKNYKSKKVANFNIEKFVNQLSNINMSQPLEKKSSLNKNMENKKKKLTNKPLKIRSITRLYKICLANDTDYKLTDDYTVSDICVMDKTLKPFPDMNNKYLLFIGKFSGFYHSNDKNFYSIYGKCKKPNTNCFKKIILYVKTKDEFEDIRNKALQINKDISKVKFGVVALFKDCKNNKYNSSATISINQIHIPNTNKEN